jgi:hypothetical protein
MEITLTTPALLFPAISLILLAYTNRFLAVAKRIRELKMVYQSGKKRIHFDQIRNLRRRLIMMRNMQELGVAGLLGCVLCMFLLFAGEEYLARWIFGISLLLMIVSLGLSMKEISISVQALNLELTDLEIEDIEKLEEDSSLE